jgi:hypothetical protein
VGVDRRGLRPRNSLSVCLRSVLAHFSHHEAEDRLPWPWVATIVVAVALAVAALAILVPDALGG